MLSFEFRLLPLADVAPWGADPPRLHWFGLTDGEYWVQVGDAVLFRHAATGRPVAYQVAQLWEDLLGRLPRAMEPVPADLVAFVESVRRRVGRQPFTDDHVVEAVGWVEDHDLVSDHLAEAPRVRMFRTILGGDDRITIEWHPSGGPTAFLPPHRGRLVVPTGDFVDAVASFDHRLMDAMSERLELLRQAGGVPGVQVDLDEIAREHLDRSSWLTRAWEREPGTDWEAVRRGAARLLDQ